MVKSLGTIKILLASPVKILEIPVILLVVVTDILELIGSDVLDRYSLIPENVVNQLWHGTVLWKEPLEVYDEWNMPLHRTDSHLYAEMAFSHTPFTQCLNCESSIGSSVIISGEAIRSTKEGWTRSCDSTNAQAAGVYH